MKIAHIICTYPPYKGGMGNSVANFATGLSALNNQLTVFTPNYRQFKTKLEITNSNLNIVRLFALLKSGNAAFMPQLLAKLKNFELVHFHYPFYGASLTIILNKFLRPRNKLIIHYHMDSLSSGIKGLIFKINRILILPILFKQADKIVCASLDYVANSSIKSLYLKHKSKFTELPFGVDSDKFFPTPNNSTQKKLLFVGGLDQAHYFKGLELLLKAFKKLTLDQAMIDSDLKFKLDIVGNGELKKYYEDLALELKISHQISITDKVDDHDLIKFYQNCDLFILPSINQGEAFGLVLLEAMSTAKPVIASHLPGVRTVFRDERDGLLFKTNDLDDLTAKIKRILLNPALAESMGRSAREYVLEKYDWKKIVNQLNRLYQSLNGN